MCRSSEKSSDARVKDLLHAVCKVWSAHIGQPLTLPQLQSFDSSTLKQFCVGLLENPDTHPWRAQLKRIDERRSLSVAGSLFLFRKCLPAEWDEGEMCRKHRSLLIPQCRTTERSLPADYLPHVRRIASEVFTPGWDQGYKAAAWSSVPSVGACTGSPRSQGGSRGLKADRRSYLRKVLGDESYSTPIQEVEYKIVETQGKGRGVTIGSSDMGLLSPLHRKMYDHLSTTRWLLRGEAKPGSFRRFSRKKGEVFVSGDYESATDNLDARVCEVLLDVAQSSSYHVPSSVWLHARSTLHCMIRYPDLAVPLQSEGQLMGNLLCFPLLCLQNYCGFRYVFGADVPVKINGDDIVFRSTPEKFEEWSGFVASVGLKLSRGKTLVSENYFSLNSSFFWSRCSERPPRLVPVTRVGCFTKPFEDWGSLSGSLRSFTKGFRGEALLEAQTFYLKRFLRHIRQSGRSVRRGLRMQVSVEALQRSGLWRRECWYFESVPASLDELPISPSRLKWSRMPEGWKRVDATSAAVTRRVRFVSAGENPRKSPLVGEEKKRVDDLQRCFWSMVSAQCWQEAPTRGELLSEYQKKVVSTGKEGLYLRWRRERSGPRLRGCYSSFAKRCRVSSHAARMWVPPSRRPTVWMPIEVPVEEEGDSDDVRPSGDWKAVSPMIRGVGFDYPTWLDRYDPVYGCGYE